MFLSIIIIIINRAAQSRQALRERFGELFVIVWEKYSVGWEKEGCSRQWESEQRTSRSLFRLPLSLSFHFAQEGAFTPGLDGEVRETGWQVWWRTLSKKGKVTVAILKPIPFFDWQPVKHFGKRSSVFMSAFVKSSFGCTILNRASTFAVVLRLRTNK